MKMRWPTAMSAFSSAVVSRAWLETAPWLSVTDRVIVRSPEVAFGLLSL